MSEGFPSVRKDDLRYVDAGDGLEVNANGVVRRSVDGLVYKPSYAGKGYPAVCFHRGGVKMIRYVHRLVCTAFHGVPPTPRHVVNHKNGNKRDNCASNLEWTTPEENRRHARLHGLILRGNSLPNAKLTAARVRRMRQLKSRFSYTELGAMFGVNRSVAHQAVTGQTWKHVQ